jgi:hypothetical protein
MTTFIISKNFSVINLEKKEKICYNISVNRILNKKRRIIMINPDICHRMLVKNTVPLFTYNSEAPFYEQRKRLKEKFIELTGLDLIAQNAENWKYGTVQDGADSSGFDMSGVSAPTFEI